MGDVSSIRRGSLFTTAMLATGILMMLSFNANAQFTNVPPGQWQTVASSANGTTLIAGQSFGSVGIYISTNSGSSWFPSSTLSAEGVACSADGTKMAECYNGAIYLSTNSGGTWTHATNAPSIKWNAIASSADETKLAAVPRTVSAVYTSTNSGLNWTPQTNGLQTNLSLTYVASSADGSKLVVAGETGLIFTSANFGVNWIEASNVPSAYPWYSVASSANGSTLLACAYNGGNVYLSTNSGTHWIETSLPARNWNSVAESADGTKMIALANSGSTNFGVGEGGIYTSMNSGATWVSNNVPSGSWTCAAMSADGNLYVATIGGPSTNGEVYVSQTTPAPQLHLLIPSSNTQISWIAPSINFTLQQSSDLIVWTTVTNSLALNLTNLCDQVTLQLPPGKGFFRLIH